MNWSSNILVFLQLLLSFILTFDTSWDYLFDRIFMASGRFETHAKGWQNFPKPIGRLETIGRYSTGYGSEKIKTTTEDDECIYYPLVYGNEDKLKMVVNPTHRLYTKSQLKTNTPQSPLVKGAKKDKKTIGYGTGEDGCYAILRSTAAQSSPPLKHHLASVGRDLHAPVSRSTLRALSNDFEQNKDRVMTFEPPSTGGCRQSRHTNLSQNNNYVYEKKANDGGERRFGSPHFDDGFIEREDNEQLLDYCTCMCCVKGAFYHFTKDSDNEGHIADEPCSCSGPVSQCLPRWGCLGIFTLFLPCLCCYLPVKGCKKVGKKQRHLINTPAGTQSAK